MQQSSYALITGATSGIGLELASIAASKGNNLVLVARNEEKLTQLKKEWEAKFSVRVEVFPCDLSEADAPERIAAMLESKQIVPGILINNAGFGVFGSFDQTDLKRETDLIQVNIMALTRLTKLVYRKMVGQGPGKIMNVASVAGFMPGPLMAVYYASKAYVLSFSQALANEAKDCRITVTTLCPGPTKTSFEDAAGLSSSMLFKSFGTLPSAAQVAAYGYKCMEKGKTVAIYGKSNRQMVFLLRFVPRKWVTDMIRHIQRKTN